MFEADLHIFEFQMFFFLLFPFTVFFRPTLKYMGEKFKNSVMLPLPFLLDFWKR